LLRARIAALAGRILASRGLCVRERVDQSFYWCTGSTLFQERGVSVRDHAKNAGKTVGHAADSDSIRARTVPMVAWGLLGLGSSLPYDGAATLRLRDPR
jgi:hypothetical protein